MSLKRTGRDSDIDLTVVEDRHNTEEVLRELNKPLLTDEEREEIEKQLEEAGESIRMSLENKDLESEGIVLPLLSSVLLLLFIIFIVRVKVIYSLSQVLNSALDVEQEVKIDNLDEIDELIRNNVLGNLFQASETIPYNYLPGVKLTLNSAVLQENPFNNDKEYVKMNFDYGEFTQKFKYTQRQGLWRYKAKNLYGEGGYSVYFINCTVDEALEIWREMKPIWLNNENFISITVEVILHNRNLYSTLYFYNNILRQSTGVFTISKSCSGINPELYSSINGESVSIILIFSLFLVIFLIQFCYFITRFIKIVKFVFTKCSNPMNLYDYLEIILVVLELALIAQFIKLDLLNIGKFSFPLTEKAFDSLIIYATEYRDLKRTASLACIFTILRLVALLKTHLPSFGVLFETINLLKTDLFNICFIASILYIGFLLSAHILFGIQEETLSTLTKISLEYFSSLVGNIKITYCTSPSCNLIVLLTILFMIIFYFILVNLLYAAIISNFTMIKKKNHFLISAKAQMLREKTIKFLVIVLRFLEFSNKRIILKNALKYNKVIEKSIKQETYNTAEVKEKLMKLENHIRNQNSIGYVQRLKLNTVRLKDFLYKTTLVNNDLKMQMIRERVRNILIQEKVEEKFDNYCEFNVEYNFKIIKNFFCYFLLTAFFLTPILLVLMPRTTFELFQVNKNYLYNTNFYYKDTLKLDDIKSSYQLYSFLNNVIVPLSIGNYSKQNFVYPSNSIRLTLNFYSTKVNENSMSKEVLSNYLVDENDFSDFRGISSRLLYINLPRGNSKTYKSKGGVSFTIESYNLGMEIMKLFEIDKLFAFPFDSLAIEFVTCNQNLNTFTYNSLFFKNGLEDLISTNYQATTINPDITSKDSNILPLIILALICSFYFFVTITLELIDIWKEKNAKRIKKNFKFKTVEKVLHLIYEDETFNQSSHTYSYLLAKLKMCVTSIYSNFIQICLVLWTYHTNDLFTVLQSTSLILTNYILFSLIALSISPFPTSSIQDFSEASDYQNAIKTLTAVNSMTLLLQIPRYLLIFPEISMLIKSILKAKLDFIFFCIMFYTILYGYIFSGNILLGHFHPGFTNIADSFITCYLMQFGIFEQNQYSESDSVLGLFYIFFYIIIIIFFLTTIFTGIITGYYENKKTRGNKLGVFEKVIKTIQCKWRGKKVIEMQDIEENENFDLNSIDRVIITAIEENEDMYDGESQVFLKSFGYLSELDTNLRKFGVNFFRMNKELNENFKFDEVQNLVNLNFEQWDNEPFAEQVKIWNSLSEVYERYKLVKDDYSKVFGTENVIPIIATIQENLWGRLDNQEKMKFWKANLTEESRAYIWDTEKDPEEIKDLWIGFNVYQKIEYVREYYKENSLKSKFWKALNDPYVKLKLIIRMRNFVDYEFFAFLIINDTFESPSFSELYDEKFSQILDNKMFCYYNVFADCLEQSKKLREFNEKLLKNQIECESLVEYKNFLIDEIENLKLILKKSTNKSMMRS